MCCRGLRPPRPALGEAQQEAERVPPGGHRMMAGLALSDQPLDEEGL